MFPANRERTFCFPWVNHGPFALHPHLCKSTCTPIVNVLSDFRRILSNVGGWSYLQKHLLSRQLLAGWFLPFFFFVPAPVTLAQQWSGRWQNLGQCGPPMSAPLPRPSTKPKRERFPEATGMCKPTDRFSEDVLKDFCLAGRKERHSETSSTELEYNP